MTLSNSILAYNDCFKLFDKALEAAKGIRIEYGEEKVAGYHGLRFNKARSLDRERNAKIYPEGDAMHGQSLYDAISIRRRQDDEGIWYVILVKIEAVAENLPVTDLIDDDPLLAPPKPPEPGTKVELELIPMPVETKIRRI